VAERAEVCTEDDGKSRMAKSIAVRREVGTAAETRAGRCWDREGEHPSARARRRKQTTGPDEKPGQSRGGRKKSGVGGDSGKGHSGKKMRADVFWGPVPGRDAGRDRGTTSIKKIYTLW